MDITGILLTALGGSAIIIGPAIANWLFEGVQNLSAKLNSLNPLLKRGIIAFVTVLFVQLLNQVGVALDWTDLTAVTSQEWANLLAILLGQLFKTQDSNKAMKMKVEGLAAEALLDSKTLQTLREEGRVVGEERQ